MPSSTRRPRPTFRELARPAIVEYSQPGDLIIDPMCGSGDVLVEAVRAERMAIGVESEKYWVDIARYRIEMATEPLLRRGYAAVIHGDPKHVADLIDSDIRGRAALVIASPQCESSSFEDVLDQCRSLLRPGGRLFVVHS